MSELMEIRVVSPIKAEQNQDGSASLSPQFAADYRTLLVVGTKYRDADPGDAPYFNELNMRRFVILGTQALYDALQADPLYEVFN